MSNLNQLFGPKAQAQKSIANRIRLVVILFILLILCGGYAVGFRHGAYEYNYLGLSVSNYGLISILSFLALFYLLFIRILVGVSFRPRGTIFVLFSFILVACLGLLFSATDSSFIINDFLRVLGISPESYNIPLITRGVLIAPLTILFITHGIAEIRKSHRKLSGQLLLGIIPVILFVIGIVGTIVNHYKDQSFCRANIAPHSVLKNCDFSGQNLSHMDLSNSDFTNANLSGTDLTGTDLTGAILAGANLQGVIGLTDEMLARFLSVTPNSLSNVLSPELIRLQSRKDIQDRLKVVCLGSGLKEASPVDSKPIFHPLMALDVDRNGLYDVPPGWEPMALRFAQYVACFGEQKKEVVDTCEYGQFNQTESTIDVNEYTLNVKLASAQTGHVVDQKVFFGGKPDCPESTANGGEITGNMISFDQVKPWLEAYVNPIK